MYVCAPLWPRSLIAAIILTFRNEAGDEALQDVLFRLNCPIDEVRVNKHLVRWYQIRVVAKELGGVVLHAASAENIH